ncbi:chlorophyll synthesis pathway protein BchC [Sphingomonas sanxanigenens]|uniref:2-desacetyl-2-hydroxyethyl bacteriochlorophyllide A dehydrogenase n=1 Tax=Sphingomonas sanxanigenens DSM 19645 = NX02 TaxID=1123269 RepID=W0AI72_9SPHN|nr:chlorophyll synthesis pathway protein BchC [Sphingomonas sanxanigenens]AHE55360.1 2-desacetyl-2-hydroxyethyl bacteriochlorophyllide A dehydrogenase [Sphingomonas sanxanigenens DSM 19645 = NX02]
MDALAVILEAPEQLALRPLALNPIDSGDVRVEIDWSGISSGTEKLLWTGRMPNFPGMGYPLVPGYESVGRIVDAGEDARRRIGEWVFVPGASCYVQAKGLFGGTARTVIVPSARAMPIAESLGREGILLALAATAHHAVAGGAAPELIIGHGILGRLIARLAIARGMPAPVIWETNALRRAAAGYAVIDPAADPRRDYRTIYDASGATDVLDITIPRLAKGGEIVLAGFYDRLSFAFAPAFMREARLRIAAEFTPTDIAATTALIASGALKLDGLISHARPAAEAASAYPQAFTDPDCLKMVLDWRNL